MGEHDRAMVSEEVRQLLDSNPYDKDTIPTLEAYVDEQLASGEGDIDANTALLKLYQFHPEATNVSAVRKILILAMKSMPESEFQLCLFLVSQKVQEEESLAELIAAWNLLECADFAGFWKATANMTDLHSAPGLTTALRSCEALVEAVERGLEGGIVAFKQNSSNLFVPPGRCAEDFVTAFQKVLHSSAMQ